MSDQNQKNATIGKLFFLVVGLFVAAMIWANMNSSKPEGRDDCIAERTDARSSVADKAEAIQICENMGR